VLPKLLRLGEIAYLLLIISDFYLLFESHTGEAHTVWETLSPALLPLLFVTTLLLFAILLAPESIPHKLLFVIAYSVLTHSFFSIIFPGGDLSGQQMVLGRSRLIYDNAVLHGWPPWPVATLQERIYQFLRGENFQAGLSVVLSRMFSIDLMWIHLSLVPVLWGVFTPIATYLATNTLTKNGNVSVLASVLLSAFPYLTYFGAISVPVSLGFIFFFFSLYFMLKSLDFNDSKTVFLMLAFSFLSFLAHYLAGFMSLSLLLLTAAYRSRRNERSPSTSGKLLLIFVFIVSASVLPLALLNLRFFRAGTQINLSLDKFFELPLQEVIGLFFLGELIYSFDLKTILLVIVGPILALIYTVYYLSRHHFGTGSENATQIRFHFVFAAFALMLIDYRVLKLFMSGLPLNEERLWVFRDFIAAPLVALAIYSLASSFRVFIKTRLPSAGNIAGLKLLPKHYHTRIWSVLLALNILTPILLGGWITLSLSAAYPQAAPLQTTSYELAAVKYIDETTGEKYVVIGDIWTIFAGERIAGLHNPRAYYFLENEKIGNDLFAHMRNDPSPQWMQFATNYTDTTVAYFVISEPRLGKEDFRDVVSRALQTPQLTVVGIPGVSVEKLYVFRYTEV
jgi:hypothetical protein